MPHFRYTALDAQGARARGVIEAASESVALAQIESKSLTPVTVEQPRARRGLLGRGASPAAMARAYSGAADLLAAGVPLLKALSLLGRGKSHPAISGAVREVAERVADGEELSVAMGQRPAIFHPTHVAMIRAGERGGKLDDALHRLGELLERQAELRAKVLGSLVYPGVLATLGVGVLLIVFVVFVPQFRPLFARLQSLPGPTTIVFGVSDALTRHGLITLIVVVGAVVGGLFAIRRPGVARWVDDVTLKAPIVGPLIRAVAVARLFRMLGTMLASGVPLLAALRVARDASTRASLTEAVDKSIEAVRAGEPLASPLAASGLLSEDIAEMVAVGEAANTLETVLTHVAESLERRVDRRLAAGVKLVEPLLLVVLAGVVGLVAVALLLPLTQLSGEV